MIDEIFELVEAPVDRAGFITRSCRRGGFPKLVVPNASARMLHQVLRLSRTRIEGGQRTRLPLY